MLVSSLIDLIKTSFDSGREFKEPLVIQRINQVYSDLVNVGELVVKEANVTLLSGGNTVDISALRAKGSTLSVWQGTREIRKAEKDFAFYDFASFKFDGSIITFSHNADSDTPITLKYVELAETLTADDTLSVDIGDFVEMGVLVCLQDISKYKGWLEYNLPLVMEKINPSPIISFANTETFF